VANLEQQLALEREMLQIGADAFSSRMNRKRKLGTESLSVHGDMLAALGVDRIVDSLRQHREAMRSGAAGRGYAHLGPLLQLSPSKVAAVAMRVVLDQLTQASKFQALAIALADRLWLETMLARATPVEVKLHKRVRYGFERKRKDAMRLRNTFVWTPQEKLSVGSFLIYLVEQHTGMIEVYMEKAAMRTVKRVRATKAALAWVRKAEQDQRLLCPFALPTLIPPRDWVTPLDGGYWTEALPGNVLFKTNAELIAAQSCPDGNAYLLAANLQQAVGWRINQWILAQVLHAWEHNVPVGALLAREETAIPPYPKHLPDDHEEVHAWKVTARRIHESNDRNATRRLTSAKQLWVAKRLADEPTLYFPVQCDFRGRYYYRPPYLNPQGNDVARSLLQFANGTPISTEREADWLRIHGANAYGYSKLKWADRVAWVHQHHQQILTAGQEPWCCQGFWTTAKDPWQFLAFCRAYQQFIEHGHGWICHQPVVLDCTCSGIQHYAALLRSGDMAELVNLTPSETPRDIYNTVLQEVLQQVRRDASDGNEHAANWLQLSPDRTLAKPVVMTIPFSATREAVVEFCRAWATERASELLDKDCWCFKRGSMAGMHYMATILYRETTALVAPAKAAMSWFRKIGKQAAELGLALSWTTPSGLPVVQEYWDYSKVQVRLYHLSSVPLQMLANHQPTNLNCKRMGNALSPNVIHSLDASHMAAVAIESHAAGVRNLGGIHDCFATTPAEMAVLRTTIRSTFASMYARDWLTPICDELIAQFPTHIRIKLPPRPQLGGFNAQLTNNADYFVT